VSFRRYPEYRATGVERVAQAPAHWAFKPLKAVATCNDEVLDETTPPDYEMLYVEISGIDVNAGIVEASTTTFEHAPSRARRRVKNGDVLVSTVRTYLRAISPVVGPPENMIVSTGFAAIRPRQIEQGFLGYVLRGEFYIAEVIARSVGVSYPAINASDLMRFAIPVPPIQEQIAISAFLDRETGKIDALVAEQERLIALLEEKRQAVVSHVVTKGLNPSAPMRPSGAEWLGDMPAHWNIVPLKWLTDPKRPIMYGIVLPGPDVGEGIPILKGGNVKPARMNLESMARTTAEIEAPYARARLKAGDLVYSIRGSIGDCEVVPAEMGGANITQDVARIAVAETASTPWVRWALLAKAVRDALASDSLGAAVRGVNIFDLKRANLPTPPLREQEQIACHINRETSRIDTLIAETQRAIALLKERRSALISAAVTGQIDVRPVAAAEAA
jgi:type I restriction enzyme, S subunit